MRLEEVPEFKRDLSALMGNFGPEEMAERVKALLRKYELPATREGLVRRRRTCKTPPVPIASWRSGIDYVASGHRAVHAGHMVYVSHGGSEDLGWCPTLNALLYRSVWWTGEDNYQGIREEVRGRVRVLSEKTLAELLLDRGRSLSIIWTEDELRSLGPAPSTSSDTQGGEN